MTNNFHVGLVADLLGPDGQVVFEDFGLDLLDKAGIPRMFWVKIDGQ